MVGRVYQRQVCMVAHMMAYCSSYKVISSAIGWCHYQEVLALVSVQEPRPTSVRFQNNLSSSWVYSRPLVSSPN